MTDTTKPAPGSAGLGAAAGQAAAGWTGVTGTAAPPAPALAAAERAQGPSRGFWRSSLERLLRNRPAMAALLVLAVMATLSFAAPLIARATGLERDTMDLVNRYRPVSATHWFGTDEYGRDYFIRILYGGQISILMGLGVASIIIAIAVPLGLIAGYYGGLVDDVFNWVVQVMVTTPLLFVLILVVTWIPPTPVSLAVLIGALGWVGNARQARGLTFQLKRTDYVLAARALGATDRRIMFRHIMPNMASLMLVLAGFDVVAGILAELGLSYLGLGIRPPIPSWGNMLFNSLDYIFRAPHLVLFPGLAVGLIVLCVYTFADGLRDAFDPRLKD
ncbi:MAG TPA: ABC transporter permease [Chloroflexota bacterium]|nr:ABC transporter permease [Chloroflexota bacterium]